MLISLANDVTFDDATIANFGGVAMRRLASWWPSIAALVNSTTMADAALWHCNDGAHYAALQRWSSLPYDVALRHYGVVTMELVAVWRCSNGTRYNAVLQRWPRVR